MKVLRLIFGRFAVISLLVILQVVIFVMLFVYLETLSAYYFTISMAFTVLGILIVIILINRQTNPNYIIPWIVIILLLPMLGVIVYSMFSKNRLYGRRKKLYRAMHDRLIDYIPADQEAKQRLMEHDKHMYGQSEYLLKASKMPVYGGTYTKYLSSGEAFFQSLKEEIRKAKRFIFMEFFTIKKGMMWNSILDMLIEKIEQGVEVRFMYDDIGSINTVSSRYYKKLRRLGIKCVKFHRFLPIVSAVHNNRDHRKLVVIDGTTALMTGCNLTDEYINIVQKHGHWKDSAILLKGEAVRNMTVMFLESYNAQTRVKEDFSPYLPQIKTEGKDMGFVQPFGDGPVPLYNEKISQNALLNIISQAKDYVYITTPYLVVDFQLTEAIKQAARRGVDVRIVTPHKPDKKIIFLMTRSSYQNLIEAGAKIYEYTPGFMHAKNIIADDKVAIVGTINLDYRSLVHHFECGVWMYNTPAISEIRQDFTSIFAVSHEVSYEESKLKFFPKLVKSVLQLFAPLL